MSRLNHKSKIMILVKALLCVFSFFATAAILFALAVAGNNNQAVLQTDDVSLMDSYDALIGSHIADAKEGAMSVRKRYWINESATELPPRDDTKYGTAEDASQLQWLLDEAAPLLEGQETLFNTEIEIYEGSEITYYLDESILAITWQQVMNRMVYTIAEVKISDASQFRRYMSNNTYGSSKVYTTTQMSAQVGAVLASSADHYMARNIGIVVYKGEVRRFTGTYNVDTCFVDANGNLHLESRGTFEKQEELEKYIEENNIKFSFAFGPILIKDGVRCEPNFYSLGEIHDGYPRCAICQKDDLHYLIVTANGNGTNFRYPTISMFADQIETFDVQQAYTLDGGQTGAIAMQDQLMNPTEYSKGQRLICDILFFATAVPETKS